MDLSRGNGKLTDTYEHVCFPVGPKRMLLLTCFNSSFFPGHKLKHFHLVSKTYEPQIMFTYLLHPSSSPLSPDFQFGQLSKLFSVTCVLFYFTLHMGSFCLCPLPSSWSLLLLGFLLFIMHAPAVCSVASCTSPDHIVCAYDMWALISSIDWFNH